MQGNSEKSFSDSKGVSTEKHGKTLLENPQEMTAFERATAERLGAKAYYSMAVNRALMRRMFGK